MALWPDFPRCSFLTYGSQYARHSRLENRPKRRRRYGSHLFEKLRLIGRQPKSEQGMALRQDYTKLSAG